MYNDSISSIKSILGSVISNPELYNDMVANISSEDIESHNLKEIYKAMKSLSEQGMSISISTVESGIKSSISDEGIISECLRYSDTKSFRDNIAIVQDFSLKKKISSACATYQDQANGSKSGSEILSNLSSNINTLLDEATTGEENVSSYKDKMHAYVEKFKEKVNNKSGVTGLSTGIDDLDDLTAGLQPADLIIVAARPSMGKTTAAMGFVEKAALDGHNVMVFSIEMPTESLIQRSIASVGSIDQTHLRTGQLTELESGKFSNAVKKVSSLPITIDDSSSLTVTEMRLKAIKKHNEEPLSMIMVDYIQLMSAADAGVDPGNKNLVVSHITRGLKMLAKELNIPVVALSQLNRGLEQRADKRPMNSDLRDSGSVEQDADLIMFIYRDEVYNDDSPDKGTAEIIIGKQRNGGLGTARTVFEGKFSRFSNLTKISKIEPEKTLIDAPPSESYHPSIIPTSLEESGDNFTDELPM